MRTPEAILIIDSREPEPHPWNMFIPEGIKTERATLETGDFAIKGNEEGAIIERKTIPDLLGCIGRERGRFERELARSRYVGRFGVVIEGSLDDLIRQARIFGSLHPNVIIGTLAAWQRRYAPFMFAGSQQMAAEFALRFLFQPLKEAARLIHKVESD